MTAELMPLAAEQLLIEHLPVELIRSVAADADRPATCVISPGRGQTALALLELLGSHRSLAWYVDLFAAAVASQALNGQTEEDRVEVVCSADLPEEPLHVAAVPVLKRGEAEFARDVLQQAHQRLRIGGLLIASVDNPEDHFLHEQLQGMFDKVTAIRSSMGCVYWGRKTHELRKPKDFRCQFAFKDDDRLIHVVSRPSVFSHRRLDPGARQLMLAAEISPEDHVLDMGCGSGAVALAAALQTSGSVVGVDANARAVECLQEGARLNGLANIRAELNADGSFELKQPVDIALANPPYFGDDHISQHFVDTCYSSLRPGGALLVVTKQPSWYEEYFSGLMEDVVIFESGRYFIACGRRP
jgi:16S rRNA G1207 methylase RsmC